MGIASDPKKYGINVETRPGESPAEALLYSNFRPGPTWPGKMPTDREIANGVPIPKAFLEDQKVEEPPEYREYENQPGSVRVEAFEKMLHQFFNRVTSASLVRKDPFYPRVEQVKAFLQGKSVPKEHIDAFKADDLALYWQRYLEIFPDAPIQEAVRKLREG